MIPVILNPNAGRKRLGGLTGPTSREKIQELLERHGIVADICVTNDEDEARDLVRAAVARNEPLVVAAGGDGTIGLVASVLIGTETALGILPLGSVMNIARMLGLPRDLERAAAALARFETKTIDVGYARDRPFFEVGSVGMNAAIFREANRIEDGDFASIVRTIAVALRFRPARMTIRLDHRIIQTRALMVTASNGPYTGLAMTVAPEARLDDGRFDVGIYRRFSKLELLRHLASIAFGRRKYAPQVDRFRSVRVSVTSAHPLPCRADSLDLGVTPIEFVTRHHALRVVVPGEDEDADATPTP